MRFLQTAGRSTGEIELDYRLHKNVEKARKKKVMVINKMDGAANGDRPFGKLINDLIECLQL